MDKALEVLRAIAQFYADGGSGASISGSALLFDDDRPLVEHVDEALGNLLETKTSLGNMFASRRHSRADLDGSPCPNCRSTIQGKHKTGCGSARPS